MKNDQFKTKKEIERYLDCQYIKNYTINEDLTVDVNGSVKITWVDNKILPLNFNIVKGSFGICGKQLSSLKGCPKQVYGNFIFNLNRIDSLDYCPIIVDGSFYCGANRFTSLKGCPKIIKGTFNCYELPIKSLEHLPLIYGNLECELHLKRGKDYERWKMLKALRK